MEEKVIREFKVIETEDGYRIEIKGDKESIKQMLSFGQGFRGRHFRGPRHHGHGFGPFGFWGHGPWGHGPWGWGEEDESEGEPAADAPKA